MLVRMAYEGLARACWHRRPAHAWSRIRSGWSLRASGGVGIALQWHLPDPGALSRDLLPSCATAAVPNLLLLQICSEHGDMVSEQLCTGRL